MKRIGKLGFAALLVAGLGVQAYAVSVGSSSTNLLDASPVAGNDTEVEATQLVFSLDEVEPETEMEPAPSNVLEVGSIAETTEADADEQLVQCDTCGTGGSIVSDTVISEAYYPAPTAGYAPACSTCSSGGGIVGGSGGGFGGGGGAGGFAGGSSALRLGLIGAAVAIPLAVSGDDDDDVVVYPAP